MRRPGCQLVSPGPTAPISEELAHFFQPSNDLGPTGRGLPSSRGQILWALTGAFKSETNCSGIPQDSSDPLGRTRMGLHPIKVILAHYAGGRLAVRQHPCQRRPGITGATHPRSCPQLNARQRIRPRRPGTIDPLCLKTAQNQSEVTWPEHTFRNCCLCQGELPQVLSPPCR